MCVVCKEGYHGETANKNAVFHGTDLAVKRNATV